MEELVFPFRIKLAVLLPLFVMVSFQMRLDLGLLEGGAVKAEIALAAHFAPEDGAELACKPGGLACRIAFED